MNEPKAQLNITLNQEEIQALLLEDSGEAFKMILQSSLNKILQVECAEQLKAAPYERTDDRTDSRNGSRDRDPEYLSRADHAAGSRHRNVPFTTLVFESNSRSEVALVAGMAEMVVNSVSTRKVSRVMETLCDTSFSKSAVSDVCKDLDKAVNEFRTRPLEGDYPFLTVDATYFKVRENSRVISKAFMIAYGTNAEGHREILGFGVYANKSRAIWTDFLLGLKKRGLTGLLMITSDAHDDILNAIGKVFPTVPWQRCQFHFSRNIRVKAPKKYQAGLRTELQVLFNYKTMVEACKVCNRIMEDYRDVAESAVACLDEGFEGAMIVMLLPARLRRYYRTSNQIERVNKELKRRSKVIDIFPNEDSVLRLMGSVLIECHDALLAMRAVFSKETLASLMNSDVPAKLIVIAEEQHRLLAA